MTALRSLLFVPGDSEKKLGKADHGEADALILDLEDSVAPSRKPAARQLVRDFLDAHAGVRRSELWVRIAALDQTDALLDLIAILGGRPDGIIQPKPDGPDDVRRLSHYLDALEVRENIVLGHTRIIPVATETASAPFRLGDYAQAGLSRLAGLTWGAEDLATVLGASTNKGADGDWDFPYQVVRAACLFAARAAAVQPLDTLFADYRDPEGLRRSCDLARRQGFTGRLAIHPVQIEIINACFLPSEAEVAHARRVVAAFAAAPTLGALGLDGKMLDIPHLQQARQLLARLGDDSSQLT
jgi:citrate lyase subunit beta/citryl-CoA lyase